MFGMHFLWFVERFFFFFPIQKCSSLALWTCKTYNFFLKSSIKCCRKLGLFILLLNYMFSIYELFIFAYTHAWFYVPLQVRCCTLFAWFCSFSSVRVSRIDVKAVLLPVHDAAPMDTVIGAPTLGVEEKKLNWKPPRKIAGIYGDWSGDYILPDNLAKNNRLLLSMARVVSLAASFSIFKPSRVCTFFFFLPVFPCCLVSFLTSIYSFSSSSLFCPFVLFYRYSCSFFLDIQNSPPFLVFLCSIFFLSLIFNILAKENFYLYPRYCKAHIQAYHFPFPFPFPAFWRVVNIDFFESLQYFL